MGIYSIVWFWRIQSQGNNKNVHIEERLTLFLSRSFSIYIISFPLFHLFFCLKNSIPQLVLTALITSQKAGGVLSAVATFNVTTSSFNFLFNILDIFIDDDEGMIVCASEDTNGNDNEKEIRDYAFFDDSAWLLDECAVKQCLLITETVKS